MRSCQTKARTKTIKTAPIETTDGKSSFATKQLLNTTATTYLIQTTSKSSMTPGFLYPIIHFINSPIMDHLKKSDDICNSNWFTPQQNYHRNPQCIITKNIWQHNDRRYNDRRYDNNPNDNTNRSQIKPQYFNENSRHQPPLNVLGSNYNRNASYNNDID